MAQWASACFASMSTPVRSSGPREKPGVVGHTHNLSAVEEGRIAGACWPDALPNQHTPRLSEGPCFKKLDGAGETAQELRAALVVDLGLFPTPTCSSQLHITPATGDPSDPLPSSGFRG